MINKKIRKIDPNIKSTISAFGYSENEIEVYVAGLELGISTAKELSKRARLDLKTTEEVLVSLIKKDELAEKVLKNNVVQYKVAPFQDRFVDRRV